MLNVTSCKLCKKKKKKKEGKTNMISKEAYLDKMWNRSLVLCKRGRNPMTPVETARRKLDDAKTVFPSDPFNTG
jgi:hypothetical protein